MARTLRGEWEFSGGVNTALFPFSISDNESSDEKGFSTERFPARATEKESVEVGTQVSGWTRLLCSYLNQYLIRIVGGTCQKFDGTDWVNITTGLYTADYDYTFFNDKLFIVNGAERMVYDGTTLASFGPSAIENVKLICSDVSRIFVAKGDTIHFCGFQNENDWTSAENSGLLQYYTPRGGDITAMTEYYGDKWIFKKDAMAVLKGTSYFNYQLVEVSNDVGCVNHKTLVEVGDTLFWLGENDVYAHNGGKPSPIGNNVRKYLDAINWNAIDTASAFTDGLRYYLSLPIDGSTSPNVRLMYDTRYRMWMVNHVDEGIVYGCRFNNDTYFGTQQGKTMRFAASPNATKAWSITSKVFDEGIAEVLKEYKELHIQCYMASGATLKVEYSISDRENEWTEIPLTISSSASMLDSRIIIPLHGIKLTNWVRFRISGTGYVELGKLQRYFRTFRR